MFEKTSRLWLNLYRPCRLKFATSYQGLLYLPHVVCMQTTKAQISLRICTVHQLALESMIAEPATCEKIKFNRQTCMRGSRQFQRGGGVRIASREVSYRNKWQLVIFQGRSGPPAPCPLPCLRPYQSFKQFELNRQEKMHMKMPSAEVVC